jgi:ELWxxDGT repeat protein
VADVRRALLARAGGGLAAAVIASGAWAQPALVRDLRPEAAAQSMGAGSLLQLGDQVLFFADDEAHGRELWRSDGTREGTALVKDICPGACSSAASYQSLFKVGDRALFAASDGEFGAELWTSDGTVSGTRRITDLCPGSCGSDPSLALALGERVLFTVSRRAPLAHQVWATDGTAAGTLPLAEIGAPGDGSWAGGFARLGTQALFWIGPSRHALWRTDGTPAGTAPVTTVESAFSGPAMVEFAGRLWFAALGPTSSELWFTDGTAAGTGRFAALSPGYPDWQPRPLFAFGGHLYYSVVTQPGSLPHAVWRTDGNPAHTEPAPQLAPGGRPPEHVFPMGNGLLFVGEGDWHLYSITAGEALPRRLAQFACEPSQVTFLPLGSRVLAAAADGLRCAALLSTDGTPAGTAVVQRFGFGGFGMTAAHGGALLAAPNGRGEQALWSSDGTTSGTREIGDFRADVVSSLPAPLAALGADLYFTAQTHPRWPTEALWRSDGSAAGTEELVRGAVKEAAVAAGWLYFARDDVDSAWPADAGLWRTEGGDLFRVADLDDIQFLTAAPAGAPPRLFFGRQSHGQELWTTDAATGDTRLVVDLDPEWINSGPIPSFSNRQYPNSLTAFGRRVLFNALPAGSSQPELWRSDGTAGGTARIAAFRADTRELTALADRVLFVATRDRSGAELWATDGTRRGTQLVRDLLPGGESSNPRQLTRLGEQVYFFARDGRGGEALWRSDGTPAGTARVSPLRRRGRPSQGLELVAAGGRLFFTAFNPTTGHELWTSDGSSSGTRLLEIRAGADGSHAEWLTAAAGRVYFAAADSVHGQELWTSDGTPAGTALVADLVGGAAASSPAGLRVAGDRLFFSAFDPHHGRELFAFELRP